MTAKRIKRLGQVMLLVTLLGFCVMGPAVFGQAGAGFSLLATVPAPTVQYVDTSVTAGQVWQYEVTAVNAAGESSPSNIVTATTPNTGGTHSNTLTWKASLTGGAPTQYRVSHFLLLAPGAPDSLGVTSN